MRKFDKRIVVAKGELLLNDSKENMKGLLISVLKLIFITKYRHQRFCTLKNPSAFSHLGRLI